MVLCSPSILDGEWKINTLLFSRDILYELAYVGELPLPSPIVTNKREREDDSPVSATGTTGTSDSSPSLSFSDAPPSESRTIAGSRRVSAVHLGVSDVPQTTYSSTIPSAALAENGATNESPPEMQLFSLPMYSDELGRLPLHGQLKFSARPLPDAQSMDWFSPQPGPVEPSAAEVPGMPMNTQFMQPDYYDYSFGGSRTEPSSATDNPRVSAAPYRSAFPLNGVGVYGSSSSSLPSHPRHQVGSNLDPNINEINIPLSLDNDTFAMWSNTPSGFE